MYKMTERSYQQSVVQAERGHLALLLLLNAATQEEERKTVVGAWAAIRGFAGAKRSVFFHHLAERRQWVESLLSRCGCGSVASGASGGSEAWVGRVAASGQPLASVIAIFGARKQFCVFPDLDVQTTPEEARPRSSLPGSETRDSNGVLRQEEVESVGSVLGAVLGLGPDDSGSESGGGESASGEGEEPAKAQGRQQEEGSGSDEGDCGSGHHRGDKAEVNGGPTHRKVCLVPASFGMWLERLADGSLLRHSVDDWPKWKA